MSDLSPDARRYTQPPTVPSFWRYLRDKNVWVYYNVPAGLLLWIGVIFFVQIWWASLLAGIFWGLCVGNAVGSWRLWKKRVKFLEENAAWVERMSSGPRPFPREIAQAMANFADEGKVHVAAKIALDYIKATDPEARRWMEELEAMPPEQRERIQREAMALADEEIRKEKR